MICLLKRPGATNKQRNRTNTHVFALRSRVVRTRADHKIQNRNLSSKSSPSSAILRKNGPKNRVGKRPLASRPQICTPCNCEVRQVRGLRVPTAIQKLIEAVFPQQKDTISEYSWFSNITGDSEYRFRSSPKIGLLRDTKYPDEPIPVRGGHPHLLLENSQTKQVFKAGKFSVEPIGHLMDRLKLLQQRQLDQQEEMLQGEEEKKKKKKKESPVVFEFWVRSPEAAVVENESVDVAYLQGLPALRNACFQVASNFNAMEPISEYEDPGSGSFTEQYYKDRTQGPRASVSCGAGAISRVYAAFYNEQAEPMTWRQTQGRQINLLERLRTHFPTVNGYVLQPEESSLISEFPAKEKAPDLWRRMLRNVMVAYHADQQVVTRNGPFGKLHLVNDPEQVVDQVLCAAMNNGQGKSGMVNSWSKYSTFKSQFLLEAAYHSAYLGAQLQRREQLVLTLVGGGVFGNSSRMILEAVIDAHKNWANHPAGSLTDVALVLYNGFHEAYVTPFEIHDIPYRVAAWSNGKKVVLRESANAPHE